MTAYQSITAALAPLGVYEIRSDKNIFDELKSYASALDKHRDNIENVFSNAFISTSTASGIAERESMIGYDGSSNSLSDRKEFLIQRQTFDNSSYTVTQLRRFISCLGVINYSLSETPSTYSVTVRISDTLSNTRKSWIESQIKSFVPAHCSCTVIFN